MAGRFAAWGLSLPEQKPDEYEWVLLFTAIVREESMAEFVRVLNGTASISRLNDEMADCWIQAVRAWAKPVFPDKVRGYGRPDGSTDGRLLRKLVKGSCLLWGSRAEGRARLKRLVKFVRRDQVRRAVFLTGLKWESPVGCKRAHARFVPFNAGVVKASRRYRVHAKRDLPLCRVAGKVVMTSVPRVPRMMLSLPAFGAGEAMFDISQLGIPECSILAGAASMDRRRLMNMFCFDSWGVTVRLYVQPLGIATPRPIYVRLQRVELEHDKSSHHALWAFGLSMAVSKMGDWYIARLRSELGFEVENGTGLRWFTLQDLEVMSASATTMWEFF
jgi:hypothetical protein